jgi:hypothetical protein
MSLIYRKYEQGRNCYIGSGFPSSGITGVNGDVYTDVSTIPYTKYDYGTTWVTSTNANQTLTNKVIQPRIINVTQSPTPIVNIDNTDIAIITGLTQTITSMSTNLSGTPFDGQIVTWRITDTGTGQTITWGSKFTSKTGYSLPIITVANTMLEVVTEYNLATNLHECIFVTAPVASVDYSNWLPNPITYTYTGNLVTKTIETIAGGTIEKRYSYYSGNPTILDGSPNIMEVKNSAINIWQRVTYTYTGTQLTSQSNTTIIAWSI